MAFRDIIGQDKEKQQLRQMVQGDRMPHALLLHGATGSGKLALALAMAQYVLCTDRRDGDACGECSACTKAAKLVHPDVHFSYPTVGTNALSDHLLPQWRAAIAANPYMEVNEWLQIIGTANQQGNINKDECLNIIRKLSLKIFEGSHKILIMWLPEYLAKEGNRLLKLIEEPPANTLFIFVAEEMDRILDTILSRCQLVKIDLLHDEEVLAGLLQKAELPLAEARQITYLANGNFNEALQLAAKRENNHAPLFLEWLRLSYRGNGVALMTWVEQFAKLGRENQKHFIGYGLHFLREYMVLKTTGPDRARLHDEEMEAAKKMTALIELDQLDKIIRLLSDSAYHIERNANPKILFLDVSIQTNKILKRKSGVTA